VSSWRLAEVEVDLRNELDAVGSDRLDAVRMDQLEQANEPASAARAVQLPRITRVTRVVVILASARDAEERSLGWPPV
jgi:hypothetical protein